MKQGLLIWITGLPGAGKTTIAKEVVNELHKEINNVVLVDGDEFRAIMQNELGYDKADRIKNAWLIARFCHFLQKQGQVVVCSTVSLYKEIHEFNRQLKDNYIEVFVDVAIEELIRRDQKGLYTDGLKGVEKNVIGIHQEFDKPCKPELVLSNSDKGEIIKNRNKIIEIIKLKLN